MGRKCRELLAVCLSIVFLGTMATGCGGNESLQKTTSSETVSGNSSNLSNTTDTKQSDTETPRNETLYLDGLQWGTPSNFNPLSPSPAALITPNNSVARELIYETLFMFNQLDNKLYPLLGKEYTWNGKTLIVKINTDAKWNDGKPVTAEDVVYTYELGKKYSISWSSVWTYIDGISAKDNSTVEIKAKESNFNPLMVEDPLGSLYILPKHIWTELETKAGNDGAKLMQEVNADPISSGPYKVSFFDETKIVLKRDDNYWGKAASMFGTLPAPKYIVHNIFKDNASGDTAFKNGQVDVSQQFTPQIWKLWQDSKLPIQTYLKEAPYFIPGAIPSIIFNTTRDGLNNATVRKAIAMVIDYDKIGQTAMSGYTAKISPSLMLPTDTEQSLIDASALKDLQWIGNQADAANKLLDSSGIKKGGDGIRELNGKKLSFKIECPSGWSDWNASLEIIAQCAKAIGIDIKTYFPEANVWTNDMQTGNFDIIMNSYAGIGISCPWARARQTMSSVDVAAIGQNAYYNYGRYKNAEADKLIAEIPVTTDSAKLKELWTELNKIYLKDVPTIGLMYRPSLFYAVNTSVWSGFPVEGDGTNIPPSICIDGYGIKALYQLKAK